jgi:hypothetical protein
MKRIYTASFLAIALSGYGAAVQAQDQAPRQPAPGAQAEPTEPAGPSVTADQSVTADELSGPMIARQATGLDDIEVLSANGESIGEIDEIVHSNVDGKYYGVLEVGGILGVGETERLIDLDHVEFDAEEERLYLSSSQNVEELAEFDPELFSEIDNETTVQLRSRGDAEQR